MSSVPAVIERGNVSRQEFGASENRSQADLAVAAVAAREEATIRAEYVMAERHPRVWPDVRIEMMEHCKRPRFAEIARYAKPVGKKKINGELVEQFARGFTARFAETLAQAMGNVKPFTAVTYEDDLIRVARIGVTDLQKNLPRSREVTFAKAVEKRGWEDRKTKKWSPPEGREVISQRLNSFSEPVYLVRATDDEMRNKVNSEESKTQRDFILRLCPRDILDECEELVLATLENQDKTDPTAALKRVNDKFREMAGIMPSDLEQYLGKPTNRFSPKDIQELRELYTAIRENQTTFEQALKLKYQTEVDGVESGSAAAQERVAEDKIARMAAEELHGAPKPPEKPIVVALPGLFTPDDLPDAEKHEPGTTCLMQEGAVLKRLRVTQDGPGKVWKTIEEVQTGGAPAANTARPGADTGEGNPPQQRRERKLRFGGPTE